MLLNQFFPTGVSALPAERAAVLLCYEEAIDLLQEESLHLPLRHQEGELPPRLEQSLHHRLPACRRALAGLPDLRLLQR